MSARIRVAYSLLVLAAISGFAARHVYREVFLGFQPETTSLRLRSESYRLHEMRPKQSWRLDDVVLLAENELLLLLGSPSPSPSPPFLHFLPPKSSLGCLLSPRVTTPVLGVELLGGRAAVRCEIPFEYRDFTQGQVSLIFNGSPLHGLGSQEAQPRRIKWNRMVYESVVTDTDVILFAKGINPRQGINAAPETLRCVFNDAVETAVTVSAQEIIRCAKPPKHLRAQLSGTKISLKAAGKESQIPSVAYYENPWLSRLEENLKRLLCACTMVFNAAKFLKEWVIYHSFLGVEAFFIYDNNSGDNLEEVIESLGDYNVSRRAWPWAKTQEAGFAHCAVQARDECDWMMFTDVDEFVFFREWLRADPPPANALKHLLVNKTSQISSNGSSASAGQVSLKCRDFGPSGLKEHPPAGLTQGYICRQQQERRHKSIVRLDAISSSLLNAVHHFELRPGYISVRLKPWEGAINHYKYQAWSEFKAKFRRRVSAYVVDWKEAKNAASQDRAPGLGYDALEPPGWEKGFCELNDTALRDFTAKLFSLPNGSMLWQM